MLQAVARIGFLDVPAAIARLRRIAADPAATQLFAPVLPHLFLSLGEQADPDHVLLSFERFAQNFADRAALFSFLRDNPRATEILVRLFAGSQFLTEILLVNPRYLELLAQHKRLSDVKSQLQFISEAREAIGNFIDPDAQLNALRRFQRWELLRIGVCDFFGLFDLKRVTVQLSLLADAMIGTSLDLAFEGLDLPQDQFVILALGKLGGEELNYSSDIDLLFLSGDKAADFWRIGQRLIKSLTNPSSDGFLYRVDMRLRPWGRAGELVSSLESHIGYLNKDAQLWEKQALLKARVVAGNRELGREFLRRAEPLIYNSPPDAVRDNVRGMKRKIEEELVRKGRSVWSEVKSGEGSIRDVEFVVQYLQLLHGGKQPAVRSFNTLDALMRLADCGFLHADEYRLLSDGYVFQRTVEHSLQLLHNKQTHELPGDPRELSFLSRRLDFPSSEQFVEHYRQHREAVRAVYNRYLGERDKAHETGGPPKPKALVRHLARLTESYAETFSEQEIARHAELAERIDSNQTVLVEARPQPETDREEPGDWQVTIVGYDYAGELSLICGLLLVYGVNIVDGQVFTYEPFTAGPTGPTGESSPPTTPGTPASGASASMSSAGATRARWRRGPYRRPLRPPAASANSTASPANPENDTRQKIVDVFVVRPEPGAKPFTPELWQRYAADLTGMLKLLQQGQSAAAQGELAKRVGTALWERQGGRENIARDEQLLPIEIEFDDEASEQFTVLKIRAHDTPGFLYELTNALALNGVYIARVDVHSSGEEVLDTLYVSDAHGRKIVDEAKKWELQAATVLIKHFTHLLPRSPNPQSALLHFREFVAQLFTRPDWTEELASLERTEVLDALARLLGVSDFLWSDFLRMQHANLFPVVRDISALASAKSRETLAEELDQRMSQADTPEARRDALNAFKDREMFRIDMRHILGKIAEFSDFSAELTDLAEVVVAAAVRLTTEELNVTHGAPRLEDGSPCLVSVCALGKFGGRELGFASDIELMFVYSAEGKTSGPQPISGAEYFAKLVEGSWQAIRAHREGIFTIDLRLRPYGRGGSLAVSQEAFRNYFGPDGPAWPYERQALVKLRPVAGDAPFGDQLVKLRDELIYTGEKFDVAAMRGMRERQLRQLVTPGTINAKLSLGGLVDVEYLVQGLQITHGKNRPELHETNTLAALSALKRCDILTAADTVSLCEAYNFHRRLIGALRIVRGNAKDLTIPRPDSEEFAFLARRLGYETDLSRLQSDIATHFGAVQDLSKKLLD